MAAPGECSNDLTASLVHHGCSSIATSDVSTGQESHFLQHCFTGADTIALFASVDLHIRKAMSDTEADSQSTAKGNDQDLVLVARASIDS